MDLTSLLLDKDFLSNVTKEFENIKLSGGNVDFDAWIQTKVEERLSSVTEGPTDVNVTSVVDLSGDGSFLDPKSADEGAVNVEQALAPKVTENGGPSEQAGSLEPLNLDTLAHHLKEQQAVIAGAVSQQTELLRQQQELLRIALTRPGAALAIPGMPSTGGEQLTGDEGSMSATRDATGVNVDGKALMQGLQVGGGPDVEAWFVKAAASNPAAAVKSGQPPRTSFPVARTTAKEEARQQRKQALKGALRELFGLQNGGQLSDDTNAGADIAHVLESKFAGLPEVAEVQAQPRKTRWPSRSSGSDPLLRLLKEYVKDRKGDVRAGRGSERHTPGTRRPVTRVMEDDRVAVRRALQLAGYGADGFGQPTALERDQGLVSPRKRRSRSPGAQRRKSSGSPTFYLTSGWTNESQQQQQQQQQPSQMDPLTVAAVEAQVTQIVREDAAAERRQRRDAQLSGLEARLGKLIERVEDSLTEAASQKQTPQPRVAAQNVQSPPQAVTTASAPVSPASQYSISSFSFHHHPPPPQLQQLPSSSTTTPADQVHPAQSSRRSTTRALFLTEGFPVDVVSSPAPASGPARESAPGAQPGQEGRVVGAVDGGARGRAAMQHVLRELSKVEAQQDVIRQRWFPTSPRHDIQNRARPAQPYQPPPILIHDTPMTLNPYPSPNWQPGMYQPQPPLAASTHVPSTWNPVTQPALVPPTVIWAGSPVDHSPYLHMPAAAGGLTAAPPYVTPTWNPVAPTTVTPPTALSAGRSVGPSAYPQSYLHTPGPTNGLTAVSPHVPSTWNSFAMPAAVPSTVLPKAYPVGQSVLQPSSVGAVNFQTGEATAAAAAATTLISNDKDAAASGGPLADMGHASRDFAQRQQPSTSPELTDDLVKRVEPFSEDNSMKAEVSESKVGAKKRAIIDHNAVKRILEGRERFLSWQKIRDGDLVAASDPSYGRVDLVEDIGDVVLNNLLLENSKEISGMCDELLAEVVKGEFVQPAV